jgi:hypothetical protein
VTPDTNKKDEIMEMSVLTKNYTLVFFNKKSFQEHFIEDKDLQKYHLMLHNTDICLNMIAEIADKLLINGLINNTEKKDVKGVQKEHE